MAANNQGIAHLRLQGRTACKRALISVHIAVASIEAFRAEPRPCARCVVAVGKMEAVAARRAARVGG
jgi:hypothetical protein